MLDRNKVGIIAILFSSLAHECRAGSFWGKDRRGVVFLTVREEEGGLFKTLGKAPFDPGEVPSLTMRTGPCRAHRNRRLGTMMT